MTTTTRVISNPYRKPRNEVFVRMVCFMVVVIGFEALVVRLQLHPDMFSVNVSSLRGLSRNESSQLPEPVLGKPDKAQSALDEDIESAIEDMLATNKEAMEDTLTEASIQDAPPEEGELAVEEPEHTDTAEDGMRTDELYEEEREAKEPDQEGMTVEEDTAEEETTEEESDHGETSEEEPKKKSKAPALPGSFLVDGVDVPTTECNRTSVILTEHWPLNNTARDFSEFMTGRGLTEPDDKTAACQFLTAEYSRHFPHMMEQIYRCISYWAAHPDKQPVFQHAEGHLDFPASDGRSMEKELSRLTKGDKLYFARGMTVLLLEVFNVTTTRDNTTLPSVQSKWEDLFSDGPRGMLAHKYDMQQPSHAHQFSSKVLDHYELAAETRAGCPSSPPTTTQPRIGILNRDPVQSMRSIVNVNAMYEALSDVYDNVEVIYFENATFWEQISFFASVDILVASHGAQLTGLVFAPACGALVELFPAGYYWPSYFGGLAQATGIDYRALYVSNGDMETELAYYMRLKSLRQIARRTNMCPDIDPVLEHVHAAVEEWKACCDARQE